MRTHARHNERAVMDEFVRVLFEEFQDLHKKIPLVSVRFSNLREADAAKESILTYAGSKT
jgi:hypothetical protein